MMKYEFEALAGYEVSDADYNNIIEPMYMATNLSKQDFVQTINKKRFALKPISKIVKEMKKVAQGLKDTCDHYTDYEAKARLEALVDEYMERKGYVIAGVKTAGYMFNDEMTMQKCYYPKSVSIYGFKTYKNIEVIELA